MRLLDLRKESKHENEAVLQCLEFVKNNNLQTLPAGRYDIEGSQIYAMVSEYSTVPASEKCWEAHREYVDLQMVISGEEIIQVSLLENMQCGDYVPENDFVQCDGIANEEVVMQNGMGLLLYPDDAHKPGLIFGKSQPIKKAVFKIHRSYM